MCLGVAPGTVPKFSSEAAESDLVGARLGAVLMALARPVAFGTFVLRSSVRAAEASLGVSL